MQSVTAGEAFVSCLYQTAVRIADTICCVSSCQYSVYFYGDCRGGVGAVTRDLVEFMTQTRGLRTVVEDETQKNGRL
jgi:hypothetical protein